jgi:hypothetical protein
MPEGYGVGSTLLNPFSNLSESVVTSNAFFTGAAFNLTLSYRTDSGVTSTLTWQISDDEGDAHDETHGSGLTPSTCGIAEASWSHYTSFGSVEQLSETFPTKTLSVPLGYRWARILRENSGASFVFELVRVER